MTSWAADIENRPLRSRRPGRVTWLVTAMVGAFVTWAAFAPLEAIVTAEGRVVAREKPQVVPNREGGILAELLVSQGDRVERGQVLARLEAAHLAAAVNDLAGRIDAAEMRRIRLEAEMADAVVMLVPPDIAERAPSLVAAELALFEARRADLATQLQLAGEMVAQTRRSLAVLQELYDSGAAGLDELTSARKADTEAEARYNGILSQAGLARATAHTEVLRELASLRADHRLAVDRLARAEIISPMDGIVSDIRVAAVGGAIGPGEEILEIMPAGGALLVEARVGPESIADVVAGQAATIKLSAYGDRAHGPLAGEVVFVSPDITQDERRPDLPPSYLVTVAPDLSSAVEGEGDILLRPGMQVSVALRTGERTLLQYLVEPLMQAGDALHLP